MRSVFWKYKTFLSNSLSLIFDCLRSVAREVRAQHTQWLLLSTGTPELPDGQFHDEHSKCCLSHKVTSSVIVTSGFRTTVTKYYKQILFWRLIPFKNPIFRKEFVELAVYDTQIVYLSRRHLKTLRQYFTGLNGTRPVQ